MTIDFDAAWAEADQAAKPTPLRAFGVEVDLPLRMPASAVILRARLTREGSELSLPEALCAVLAEVIGSEAVDQMVANGADPERLSEVMVGVWEHYHPPVADDSDAEGEAQAPATGAPSTT